MKTFAKIGIALFLLTATLNAQVDPDLLAGMKARAIGPAAMGGRIAAIDAVAADPGTVYLGAATGGVWKSTNSGLTWKPIFDKEPVAAIGAVAIFQASPDVIWVGTGEGNPRNSASVGNGIYKTLDGGLTWQHMGLDETERIHRIALHPTNPDIVYVAAMGKTWGEHEQRGVFVTRDGGLTWTKLLYVNETTGCADLVMDPKNPRKLIAAMWDYRRWPWFFRSGGPGSGIYLSYDAGENWKRLDHHDGLPKGELGRIGLAIAPSDPKVVYALVEAKENALYKSTDGGEKWKQVCKDRLIGNRPFYYADLRVDPLDPSRVYSLWTLVSMSEDGGKTFSQLTSYGAVHPDHHALWIDPNDPTHLINGNDGGVYVSRDRGRSWRFVSNLALGQYYHIRVDRRTPYYVYGGMQDNGSWMGPSQVWEGRGIRNFHWREMMYGDGFDTVPDPEIPDQGYAMSQEGSLARFNVRTGMQKTIQPVHPEGVELRFNWNAGINVDPFDAATVYFGSQFVHKSVDRGETWTLISPDLTTDNPEWQKQDESGGLTLDVTGAENFTTVTAIAPSPLAKDLLWVGTDDGRLHLTRDGGATWTSLEKKIDEVPQNTWIPHILPSKFDAAAAFVIFEDHRRSNWTPYVMRTDDYGSTWKNLATDDLFGYALSIEQDPVNRDLLFVGTEFGLYVTFDGGKKWFKWTHGVPTVSVMDLVIHPDTHDLVLGTHGRSAFILDDIRPLREIASVAEKPLHLFEIPPAIEYQRSRAPGTRSSGNGEFSGENPPYGALISLWISDEELPHPDADKERLREKDEPEEDEKEDESEEDEEKKKKKRQGKQVKIEILGDGDKVIATIKQDVKQGLNRVSWSLRTDPFKRLPSERERPWDRPTGPQVVPGTYRVKVAFKEHEVEGEVQVLGDPRYDLTKTERQANFDARIRAGKMQEAAAEVLERIRDTRADLDVVMKKLKPKDEDKEKSEAEAEEEKADPKKKLMKEARKLQKELDRLEKLFRNPRASKGIGPSKNVMRKIRKAMGSVGSSWDAPNAGQKLLLEQAQKALDEALAECNKFIEEDLAAFREKVIAAQIELLPSAEPLGVKEEE